MAVSHVHQQGLLGRAEGERLSANEIRLIAIRLIIMLPGCLVKTSELSGMSPFCRAGPSAFPPGRQRPGSGKNEALKRPSPPWQPAFPNISEGKRAFPALCATSARPFTAWPSGAPTILGHTRIVSEMKWGGPKTTDGSPWSVVSSRWSVAGESDPLLVLHLSSPPTAPSCPASRRRWPGCTPPTAHRPVGATNGAG